ncbi:MAG: hypothetical protein V2A79_19765 [Planctomycetota bacterium]
MTMATVEKPKSKKKAEPAEPTTGGTLQSEYAEILRRPSPSEGELGRGVELCQILFASKVPMRCPRCNCGVTAPDPFVIHAGHRTAVEAVKEAAAAVPVAERRYEEAMAAQSKAKEAMDKVGESGGDISWTRQRLIEKTYAVDAATQLVGNKRGQLTAAKRTLESLGIDAVE